MTYVYVNGALSTAWEEVSCGPLIVQKQGDHDTRISSLVFHILHVRLIGKYRIIPPAILILRLP